MPSRSKKQQQLMGADLERARQGKKTVTGMNKAQLEEFASTPHKGLPTRVKKGKQ
jgi:hypothetical protein